MRLKIFANTNLRLLAQYLPGHEVDFAEPADFPADLFSRPGSTNADYDALLVMVDAETLMSPGTSPDLDEALLEAIAHCARSHPHSIVSVNTLMPTTGSGVAALDQSAAGSLWRGARWDEAVLALAGEIPNLYVMDVRVILRKLNLNEVYADRYWYLGRVRYSRAAMNQIGEVVRSFLISISEPRRKVLVLDLDNTLWGGVLGEDGIHGIQLGEDGIGKSYRDLQAALKVLQGSGVLLAIASKNDFDLAISALDGHPMMLLRSADFVSMRINWVDKASNLESIASELDVDLNSIAFLDDSPRERALIRDTLATVAVPEFPTDAAELPRWFRSEVVPRYFDTRTLSESDLAKTSQYQAKKARSELEARNPTEFTASLGIVLNLGVDVEPLAGRVAQMTQKTNQFNLTTRRETTESVLASMTSASQRVVTCSYADRFGDEGVVAAAVLDLEAGRLSNLLVSCRVLGRGVEDEVLAYCVRVFERAGLRVMRASYTPSGRNAVCADFLARSGFERANDHGEYEWVRSLR